MLQLIPLIGVAVQAGAWFLAEETEVNAASQVV